MATHDPEHHDDAAVAIRDRIKSKRPRRWKVLLHNDDYSTMDFVVDMLRKHFHKSEAEAVHIMLQVHHKGKGVAGVYPRDMAETKISEVTADAQAQGMPLMVTMEAE